MEMVFIGLNIMAFLLGFGIGAYVYHKIADGK
jgi:hypothetical protein